MPARRYLKVLFSLLLPYLFLHIGSTLWFMADPRAFYRTEWEYFLDIGDYVEGMNEWHRDHTPDHAVKYFNLYQDLRKIDVTTDDEGFRISQPADSYEIIIGGDSQVFGSGISDNESLSWQLGELTGRAVMNGARSKLYNAMKRPSAKDAKIVIYGRTERLIKPADLLFYTEPWDDAPFKPLATPNQTMLERLSEVPPRRYSIIPVLYGWAEAYIRDIRTKMKGLDKEPYLYAPHVMQPDEFDETVDTIVMISDRVTKLGKRFIFLPIPAKQTLYADFADPFTRDFLPKLVPALRARGVEVIDILPAMEAAKGGKGGKPDVYQPYDTHWSAYGISIAAKEIARYLDENPTGK